MRSLRIALLLPALATAQVTVPFVGCASDGQVGPVEAPKGKDVSVPLDRATAAKLAYYSAGGSGVLGPRGWHCFRLYGSGGETLTVAPHDVSVDFVERKRTPFLGPVIEVSLSLGGTSGRIYVAEAITRLFPKRLAFAREVLEFFPDSFPLVPPPYTGDVLARKSDQVVEFMTPANTDGMGTQGWLKPADSTIRGVVVLLDDPRMPDVLRVSVRLPNDLAMLAPAIVAQAERDASKYGVR